MIMTKEERKYKRQEKNEAKKRNIAFFFYEIGRMITGIIPHRATPKKVLKVSTKRTITVWCVLAIPIIHFLVFWVYVNFNSIFLAFKNIDYAAGGVEYWTLKNFKEVYRLLTQKIDGYSLADYGLNTLKYWTLGFVWSIPHSILLTYVFHKKIAGYKFFRVVLYLPSIICGVVVAAIFASFISGNGAFGYVLKEFVGIERIPSWFQESEYATKALLFYSFFIGFAGQYVLYSGALAKVPTEITEAAYIDGVSMWQELWYVDIPLMWDTISMTIVTGVAGIFGASGAILIFTPNLRSTFTFSYWIFDQVRTYQSFYVPACLGLCFTAVAFPICLLVKKAVTSIYTVE